MITNDENLLRALRCSWFNTFSDINGSSKLFYLGFCRGENTVVPKVGRAGEPSNQPSQPANQPTRLAIVLVVLERGRSPTQILQSTIWRLEVQMVST